MRHHPGWLAAGLLLFAVLACNLSKNSNNSNDSNRNANDNKASTNAPKTNRPANADVYVDKVYMAKDKGGEPGDETTTFEPGDRTIHCVAELNKAKRGTQVKLVWKAVDVEGEKNGDIKTIDYTTKSFENKVHGHLTLSYDWPKGKYRVELYINDNLDKTIDYSVE